MIKLRVMGKEAEVKDFAAELKGAMRVTACSGPYPNRIGTDVRVYMDIEPVSVVHVIQRSETGEGKPLEEILREILFEDIVGGDKR